MSHLINDCRNQVPAKGEPNVLVAGDPERSHMEKCDKQGGISYHENQIKFAVKHFISIYDFKYLSLICRMKSLQALRLNHQKYSQNKIVIYYYYYYYGEFL